MQVFSDGKRFAMFARHELQSHQFLNLIAYNTDVLVEHNNYICIDL